MLYAAVGVAPFSLVLTVAAAVVGEWRMLLVGASGALLGVAAIVISHMLAPSWP
jgi:hypothetical protein